MVAQGELPPRASYARAGELRTAFDARHRALFEALEPLIAREPSNIGEWRTRLVTAAEAFPQDAELSFLTAVASSRAGDPEGGRSWARSAVELDPEYADGWQTLASSTRKLGRVEEALAALERCIALTPSSVDCLNDRVRIRSARGQCGLTISDYLDRRAAMSAPPIFDALDDPTPIMLHVRHRAGDLDAAALAAGVEQWTKMWVKRGAAPEKIWFQALARAESGVARRARWDARPETLAALPDSAFLERDHGVTCPTRRRLRRGHHAVWCSGARVPSPQPSDPPCASAALPGDRTRRQGRT